MLGNIYLLTVQLHYSHPDKLPMYSGIRILKFC